MHIKEQLQLLEFGETVDAEKLRMVNTRLNW